MAVDATQQTRGPLPCDDTVRSRSGRRVIPKKAPCVLTSLKRSFAYCNVGPSADAHQKSSCRFSYRNLNRQRPSPTTVHKQMGSWRLLLADKR